MWKGSEKIHTAEVTRSENIPTTDESESETIPQTEVPNEQQKTSMSLGSGNKKNADGVVESSAEDSGRDKADDDNDEVQFSCHPFVPSNEINCLQRPNKNPCADTLTVDNPFVIYKKKLIKTLYTHVYIFCVCYLIPFTGENIVFEHTYTYIYKQGMQLHNYHCT